MKAVGTMTSSSKLDHGIIEFAWNERIMLLHSCKIFRYTPQYTCSAGAGTGNWRKLPETITLQKKEEHASAIFVDSESICSSEGTSQE